MPRKKIAGNPDFLPGIHAIDRLPLKPEELRFSGSNVHTVRWRHAQVARCGWMAAERPTFPGFLRSSTLKHARRTHHASPRSHSIGATRGLVSAG